MTLQRIESTGDALVYMTECTLAIVEYMSTLSRINEIEFGRQITIAQNGIDWIKKFGVELHEKHRVHIILSKFNGNVTAWVANHN